MELYATGFNAHHQLTRKSRKDQSDLLQFQKILKSPLIRVRCALWSATIFESDGSLVHHGYRPSGSTEPAVIDGPPTRNIKEVFGDTSGMLGALGVDGSLYILHENRKGLELRKHRFGQESLVTQQGLTISHLAITENGEICVCTSNQPARRTSSGFTPIVSPSKPQFEFIPPTTRLALFTFSSFADFLEFEEFTDSHPIDAPLHTLHASATSFTALTSAGDVLTFGSPLHSSILARTPSAAAPARKPSPIPFFGGIPIQKVATNGWLGAAVSEDQDLYIWGGRAGETRRIGALPNPTEGEEVKLVDIGRDLAIGGGDGPADIVDVAVGAGHIVALTADGNVWAVGDGMYGQLGHEGKGFEEDWVHVDGDWLESGGSIVAVECGFWSTFVAVDGKENKFHIRPSRP